MKGLGGAIRKLCQSAWIQWDRFWFTPMDSLRFSVWRILLALLLLWMNGVRGFALELFYTDQGMILHGQAKELIDPFYRAPLFLGSHTISIYLYIALMCTTVLLLLGVGGRLTSFILLNLHLSFLQRNFSVAYGVDLITSCWLFYLSLARNNDYLALPNLWRTGKLSARSSAGLATPVAWRLMQIQLCAIYGYSGLEKLKGQPWWEGSAVWSVLGNHQLMIADFRFMQNFPTVVALASFASLAFEIYFPVLIWIKPLRKWILLMGVIFHLQIAMTMGLLAFSLIMILGYLAFLDESEIRRLTALVVRESPCSTITQSRAHALPSA